MPRSLIRIFTDLSVRCANMPEGTFSDDAAHAFLDN